MRPPTSHVQDQYKPQQTEPSVTHHPGTQSHCPFQYNLKLDFIVKLPESEGFDTILTIQPTTTVLKVAMFMPCH